MEQETKNTQITVPEAASILRQGHLVLLTDTAHPDSGILCQAAQFVNSETICTFQRLAGPTIYAALGSERSDLLRLPPNDWHNKQAGPSISIVFTTNHETLTEPISCALTLRALVDPLTHATDLISPGLLIPLRAQPGGVLVQPDYPEAAIDLLCIAGLESVAAISTILNQETIAQIKHTDIAHISLEAILAYRQHHRVSFISEVLLPTEFATFRLRHYQELATRQPYLALILGDLQKAKPAPLLRLHSACLTGDIFGSQRCDCQAQLHAAMAAIAQEGCGILLYLPQEGRGIGLSAKLQAYLLQEQGYDTLEANTRLGYPIDARDYTSAIEILHELSLNHVRLLTNNPEKIQALQEGHLLVERVALEMPPTANNLTYLQTKLQRMGHQLTNLQTHFQTLYP